MSLFFIENVCSSWRIGLAVLLSYCFSLNFCITSSSQNVDLAGDTFPFGCLLRSYVDFIRISFLVYRVSLDILKSFLSKIPLKSTFCFVLAALRIYFGGDWKKRVLDLLTNCPIMSVFIYLSRGRDLNSWWLSES